MTTYDLFVYHDLSDDRDSPPDIGDSAADVFGESFADLYVTAVGPGIHRGRETVVLSHESRPDRQRDLKTFFASLPGLTSVRLNRDPTSPGSGYYLMESAKSMTGFAAVFTIDIRDREGKSWRIATGEEAQAFQIMEIARELVAHDMRLEDVRARLDDAMSTGR